MGRTGKAKGGRVYDEEFKTPVFLTAKNLKPFITDELLKNSTPIPFRPFKGAGESIGYRAELLPHVCGVFMDAKDAGVLTDNQKPIAETCKILLKGFATVGIISLIDEATGYQYERPQKDLEEQLRAFLAESLVRYASGFPHDYLKHLCRLKGVVLRPDMRLPQYFGILTGDLIYKRIARAS